jgi:hypothetical protein
MTTRSLTARVKVRWGIVRLLENCNDLDFIDLSEVSGVYQEKNVCQE